MRAGARLCSSCGTWVLDDVVDAPLPPRTVPRQPPAAPSAPIWAPPSASQRVEQPPPGAANPFDSPFGMADEAIDEHTTLSARRTTKPSVYWTLALPNGAVELVTDRAIIVGREPQFMPALPQARLIPVPDPTRSVSKNHACFSLYGASLIVEDLGSTNGVIVHRPDGREDDIGVGGRTELQVGARVELGDAVISIGRA